MCLKLWEAGLPFWFSLLIKTCDPQSWEILPVYVQEMWLQATSHPSGPKKQFPCPSTLSTATQVTKVFKIE